MNRKKHWLMVAAHGCMVMLAALLLATSVVFKRDGPTIEGADYVETVLARVADGPWQEVTLPHNFDDLEPRTPVTVRAVITPGLEDAVYIKSVYSPAKVYLDGELVFTFGKRENYPVYMVDPATEIHMVETLGDGSEMELEVQFLSPVSRRSMIIHPFILGSVKELFMERSRVLGLPLVFSMAQLVGGVFLILISAIIVLIDKKGKLYLWLGLFSVTTGMWAFGENNFTGIVFRGSAVLYMLSFVGMFTFIVPLIHFTRNIVDFERDGPLWGVELFYVLCAGLALLLQLLGLVPCSTSMFAFHLLLPVALVILAGLTGWETVHYKNPNARRLVLPISVLAITAVLELMNYRLPVTYVFSSIFQLGILIFLLIMGTAAGFYIKDSINLKNWQKQLDFEQELMEIQLRDQEARTLLLASKEQTLRQQRHDLRHQLTAIQALAREENTELQDYLRSLMDQLPKSEQSYCENRVVNAVIAHYVPLCEEGNIALELKLAVPPCTGGAISDSELCVVFGNLLENAVEACNRMTEGERFIRLNSSYRNRLLTITMDNSFNGEVLVEQGRFRSSKRDEFGVGLTSVGSVARKGGGDVDFHSDGRIFRSSVYLNL